MPARIVPAGSDRALGTVFKPKNPVEAGEWVVFVLDSAGDVMPWHKHKNMQKVAHL